MTNPKSVRTLRGNRPCARAFQSRCPLHRKRESQRHLHKRWTDAADKDSFDQAMVPIYITSSMTYIEESFTIV